MNEELVFARVLEEFQKVWKKRISIKNLIDNFYDVVSIPANLKNKENDVISVTKEYASFIFNRKKNPHLKIREHANDEVVRKEIEVHFVTKILNNIKKDSVNELIYQFQTIIKNDKSIYPEKRKELLNFSKNNSSTKFLSEVYLFSLSRDNVIPNKIKQLSFDDIKDNPLPEEKVPVNIANHERRYVKALEEVYAEKTGDKNLKTKNMEAYPKEQDHFKRQRIDYYAAEAVRRATRDIYSDNEEKYFKTFLDEIYNGIIDVYERDYDTGFKRLEEVLIEAKNTRADQSRICSDTKWIGNSQKKGACHILVNEKRLNGWLNRDA